MATLLTPAQITKLTLASYAANSQMVKLADWSYSDKFGNSDGQIGATLQIRRPVLATLVGNNMAYAAANASLTEYQQALVVDNTVTAALQFSEADMALRVEQFNQRYISKIATQMGAYTDSLIYDAISNAGKSTNSTAFTGTLPYSQTKVQVGAGWCVFGSGNSGTMAAPGSATSYDFLRCKKLLDDMNAPNNDRVAILTPLAAAQITNAQLTLFNAQSAISDAYESGVIGRFANIKFTESPNPAAHTNGLWAGSPVHTLIAGASTFSESTTISVTGLTLSTTVRAGDMFTIGTITAGAVTAGYARVNPYTKQPTGELVHFTVLSDVTATGTDTLTIAPAIITSGPEQNCVVVGSGSKAVTILGTAGATYQESVVFQKEAIACAAVKLVRPNGMDMSEVVRDPDSGINLRLVRQYDAIGAAPGASGLPSMITRLDTLLGFKILRGEWIIRFRCS
jgi:hypothetical protein